MAAKIHVNDSASHSMLNSRPPIINGFEPTVCIEQLSFQLFDKDLYRDIASPADWHFLLLEYGAGKVLLDRKEVQFEAGSLLCIPPGTHYVIEFFERRAKAILVAIDEVVFRTQVLDLLPGNQDRSSSYWRAYYTPRVLSHSVGECKRAQRTKTARELMCLAQYLGRGGDPAIAGTALVVLMSELKRREITSSEGGLSGYDAFINSNLVIEYRVLVEQYYTQQYKVGQYAELLGVSSKTLIRACKVMTGSTAVAIIHERIVREATRELCRSQLSVAEVGYQLGFDDAGYFSRFMKEHTGKSPSEIRQQSAPVRSI